MCTFPYVMVIADKMFYFIESTCTPNCILIALGNRERIPWTERKRWFT